MTTKYLVRDEGYDVAVWIDGKLDLRFPHLGCIDKTAWEKAAQRVAILGERNGEVNITITLCPNDYMDGKAYLKFSIFEQHGLTIRRGPKGSNYRGWIKL